MADKLTPKQIIAVEVLSTSGDKSKAAELAGVSRPTIYKWLRRPQFVAALDAAEAEALSLLSRVLVRLGGQAAAALEAALLSDDAPMSVRVRAADIVLTRLLQLRELVDLENRITRLEQQLQGKGVLDELG